MQPFFVGFVLTPLASNASEFVSSLKFAARKRRKNISLTFSQVRLAQHWSSDTVMPCACRAHSCRCASMGSLHMHSLPLAQQVYGAVTMNNTLVLGLFLAVVYLQRLEWVYSSEVLVIVAATLALGAVGSTRSTFRTKWALPAVALYPASLAGVYLLDTLLGWQ